MKLPHGASYLWSVIPIAVVGIMGSLAFTQDGRSLEILGVHSRAQHASLAAPSRGPAIYSGVITGPHNRRANSGAPAAATFWWVDRRSGKNRTVSCRGGSYDGLVLRGDGVEAPVAFLRANVVPFVVAATDNNEWERPVVVDLAGAPSDDFDRVPTALASCDGRDGRYHEHRLAVGAHVEVYGCFRDGAIRECSGVAGGALSVGSLRDHRVHRAEDLREDVRFVSVLALIVVVISAAQTLVFGARSMALLTGRRRRRS